jgi:thioredoxin-dependent peroxiredoxin
LISVEQYNVLKTEPNMNAPMILTHFDRSASLTKHKITMRATGTWHAILASLACALLATARAAEPPKVGDKAPDFTLKTLDDHTVRLSESTAKRNVVLVLLRGWPGYQCPICDRQVRDFIDSASSFAEAKAQVVFVYPGPANDLKPHAQEFKEWKGKQWPKEFLYVLDPDYTLVNANNLRWDAPHETAYPSTFVLDRKGVVRSAKISHTHGGRATASEFWQN